MLVLDRLAYFLHPMGMNHAGPITVTTSTATSGSTLLAGVKLRAATLHIIFSMYFRTGEFVVTRVGSHLEDSKRKKERKIHDPQDPKLFKL